MLGSNQTRAGVALSLSDNIKKVTRDKEGRCILTDKRFSTADDMTVINVHITTEPRNIQSKKWAD